jgi:hypothetical protein
MGNVTGRITPRVLALFARMREIGDNDDEEWRDLHHELHRALGCAPWQWPAIEDPDLYGPDRHPADLEKQERWRMLERALERSRAARANGGG